VIRRYVTRVVEAELQLLINRYDFVYNKFGWGSLLIFGHFKTIVLDSVAEVEGGGWVSSKGVESITLNLCT
jgi:hypothetical protein